MTPDRSAENAQIAQAHELYQLELERFARGILKDPAAAADAVQNAFVALTISISTINTSSVRSWLYTTTLREAVRLRKQSRFLPVSEGPLASVQFVQETSPAYQTDPAEKLANQEEAARIQRRIDELPVEQKQVIELRIRNELSFAQIANQLNIPLGTALSRMRLALQKLRAETTSD